jgi:hypothetical protein
MPFQPGNSGGPGRPRGSRNAVNVKLDRIAGESAEAVVRKMVDAAAEGNLAAARLVLNRIWTAPKGRPVEFELPLVDNPEDAVRANAAVMQAMADGQLTAEEGAAFAAVIETQRRAIETLIVEKRLSRLEAQMAEKKTGLGQLAFAAE